MTSRWLLAVFILGVVAAQDDPPVTVSELDIELYVGRWYQVKKRVKKLTNPRQEMITNFDEALRSI